ncbi:hypothetical protein [Cetobacterium ceti]
MTQVITGSEVKLIVDDFRIDNEKLIKGEGMALKNLTNSEISLKALRDMISNNEPLPQDSPYDSFEEWEKHLLEIIKSRKQSIENIKIAKVENEFIGWYLANGDNSKEYPRYPGV